MRRITVLIVILTALAACKSNRPDQPEAQPPVEETTAEPGADPAEEAEKAEKSDPTASPIVISDDEAPHRTSPNGKAEVIQHATGTNAFLGKLTMEAGAAVPKHRDETEEYIYILEGSGVMTIDGKEYEVGPNTAIYMPANAEVSFQNGKKKTVALQVFAGPGPAEKYEAWTPAGEE
jgi:mannose-6-phosphate isomerase-like protein (cupin superfamily)